MELSSRGLPRISALAVVAALAVAACVGGGSPSPGGAGGSISILAVWTGTEEDSFRAMIKPWVDANGVNVQYQGQRDIGTPLNAAIQSGSALPDIAGVPGPGEASEWAKVGALKPLDFINLDEYRASSALADLGIIDGKLYGIFTKAAVKGLIWYNKANYDGTAPATWDALQGMDPSPAASLWCNAFESGGDSGWPGTDWVEDFLIRESGPDVYDSWVAGKTKWTSPEVKSAFQKMVDVLGKSAGGSTYINATTFLEVGAGLFATPPTCKLVHQASFIGSEGFIKTTGATADQFDFFVMPDINSQFAGAITGGGDEFGMFNDTPQARSLLQYLLTPEAQAIWAGQGGFIAANKNVPSSAYKEESDRKAGEAVAKATVFRFDGGDLMPGLMKSSFFAAMVKLAANPGDIDSILADLDTIQAQAYTP